MFLPVWLGGGGLSADVVGFSLMGIQRTSRARIASGCRQLWRVWHGTSKLNSEVRATLQQLPIHLLAAPSSEDPLEAHRKESTNRRGIGFSE